MSLPARTKVPHCCQGDIMEPWCGRVAAPWQLGAAGLGHTERAQGGRRRRCRDDDKGERRLSPGEHAADGDPGWPGYSGELLPVEERGDAHQCGE